MKQLIYSTVFFFFSFLIFGQETSYPFSIEKSGKGKQAIIFIPGFASSGEVWNDTKIKFEQKYTCYTLTMAGFAGVKAQPNATFEYWVNAIANYINENKIEKPILVGHSMGGAIALAIAADYPNLLNKIVVVDALPFLQEMTNPNAKSNIKNDCSPIIDQFLNLTDEQFFQMQQSSIPSILENVKMRDTVIEWSLKSDRRTFAEMFCDFWNTDLRDKIKNIQCDALILLEFPFVNLQSKINEQYKNLKTANLQYATKGLHFIMYDDKEWYLNQLTNFIDGK